MRWVCMRACVCKGVSVCVCMHARAKGYEAKRLAAGVNQSQVGAVSVPARGSASEPPPPPYTHLHFKNHVSF